MGAAVVTALLYVAYNVYADATSAGVSAVAFLPFALLFVALLIALGFEFVNGYAQGASAELVAMGTIFAADHLGLPVSTTHVLSSGAASTGSSL